MRRPATIATLPAEALLEIFGHLDALSLQRVASTCRGLRQWATHDALWRALVEQHLAKSPPAKSHNVSAVVEAPMPWDAAFGLISIDNSAATRNIWPVTMDDVDAEAEGGSALSAAPTLFEGASGYHDVWLRFVRPMDRLLGWWASDAPSFGMLIRIVFDPCLPVQEEEEEETQSGSAGEAMGKESGRKTTPAFVCEKVQVVNRLHGMGRRPRRGPGRRAFRADYTNAMSVDNNEDGEEQEDGWSAVNSFPLLERSQATVDDNREWLRSVYVDEDGTTLEGPISVDIAFVGIKTERLWAARWSDVVADDRSGAFEGAPLLRRSCEVVERDWCGEAMARNQHRRNGEGSTMAERASRLAREMVFGSSVRNEAEYDAVPAELRNGNPGVNDEDKIGQEEEVDTHGAVNVGVLRARRQSSSSSSSTTQPNPDVRHIVYPSSGAILTFPASSFVSSSSSSSSDDARSEFRNSSRVGKGTSSRRIDLRLHRRQPYRESNHHRPGGPRAHVMPQHPTDFPPPSLLSALRNLAPEKITVAEEEMEPQHLQDRLVAERAEVEVDALGMSPAPPYRPWPHLAHPLLNGPLFFPIVNPLRQPVRPLSRRVIKAETDDRDTGVGGRRPERGEEQYVHIAPPRRLDPACEEFDWSSLEGLFGMTYGPWGMEVIYLRSRYLTIDDYEVAPSASTTDAPPGATAGGEEFDGSNKKRRTILDVQQERQQQHDDAFWDFEPKLKAQELRRLLGQNAAQAIMEPSTSELQGQGQGGHRKSVRVVEGVKVSGDANVPRGSVSFRAFVLGQQGDFGFGDGRGDVHAEWQPPPTDEYRTWTPWPLVCPIARRRDEERASARASSSQNVDDGGRSAFAPGRLLRAVGRLAREGFASASWTTAMVKINSPDEVQICWNSLGKVSIAKRLTAC